jgi:hypothetical protein
MAHAILKYSTASGSIVYICDIGDVELFNMPCRARAVLISSLSADSECIILYIQSRSSNVKAYEDWYSTVRTRCQHTFTWTQAFISTPRGLNLVFDGLALIAISTPTLAHRHRY